jgi:hypothetical protein
MQKAIKNPAQAGFFYLGALICMRIFSATALFNSAIDLTAAGPALDCCQIGVGIGWCAVALGFP